MERCPAAVEQHPRNAIPQAQFAVGESSSGCIYLVMQRFCIKYSPLKAWGVAAYIWLLGLGFTR